MIGFVNVLPRAWQSLVLIASCSLLLAGCAQSDPVGSVEGTVTLRGEPYSDAAVVLLDMQTGQAASADIQPGGTFRIESLPVGTYTVYLAPKSAPVTDEPQPVTIDTAVPDKYWNEATSDIQVPVAEGPNQVQVELAD